VNFTQIVGLDAAKQALMLLAVDPTLGGVVLAAPPGSGKSTLARAFAGLRPDAPFVELPVSVTEDRLIGGIDLEATLATGLRSIERGLLARAHGGVLYVDGLNLLDSAAETALIAALSDGMVRVERDGLSATHPATFCLLATYDPREGEIRRGLLDRVAMVLPFAAMSDPRAREAVVRANLSADRDDDGELAMLCALIEDARTRLAAVSINDAQLSGIAQAALSLGVEGNRADVFAVRAAIANAALNGRDSVDDDDLKLAARLVLMPRATRLPEREADAPPPSQTPSAETRPDTDTPESDAPETPDQPQQQQPAQIEALMLDAAETELPTDVLALPFAAQRHGSRGSRGEVLNNQRGKFVRAVPAAPRGNKVSVLHTLLAAAPWQTLRRAERTNSAVSIRPADLRVKRFRDKAGTLYVFVVDASGSMALNRMREAKGAAARLLQNAYVHRDQVALIAFRGQQAQVLLPPSTSVDRAKRELDVLPTGGGTPLAHALLSAWQLAKGARSKGVQQTSLVLLTDGRGNIPLNATQPATRETLRAEVDQISTLIAADGVASVVIDTQSNHVSRGEAGKLAAALGGRYVYLPNARADQIVQSIGSRPA
jgi:magnesium chelatase subunit D